MKVTGEEAKVIKEAEAGINAKIRGFRANYTHQDDLDIALMTCLDIMTEFLSFRHQQSAETQEALHAIERLEAQLSAAIQPEGSQS